MPVASKVSVEAFIGLPDGSAQSRLNAEAGTQKKTIRDDDGEESFVFHVIATTAPFPDTIWGADIDGDGDIDVFSAALIGDQIAWYENGLVISVETDAASVPVQFALLQNYPNPFNPTTSIQFSIPEKAVVRLAIYDILGSEVATLVNEERDAGTFKVNFDAARFASGTYFYRLESGGFVQTKRMLLLK